MTKLLKPDQLVLVLFLTNQKQANLTGVSLSPKPSSNLQVRSILQDSTEYMWIYNAPFIVLYHLVCILQAKTGSGEVDLTFQTSLAGFATSVHVVTLVPSSPALRMNLQGQLAYIDALATNKRLFFDTTIPTSDFIRCVHMHMGSLQVHKHTHNKT